MQIFSRTNCVQPTGPNDMAFCVLVLCCNMTLLDPKVLVQHMQLSKICVYHIHCILQTFYVFHCLVNWKRCFEASLSSLRMRFHRQWLSGCKHGLQTFFLDVHELLKFWTLDLYDLYNMSWRLCKKWCKYISQLFNKLQDKNCLMFLFHSLSYKHVIKHF